MDPDTEREINHIWERLRSHDSTVSGVTVLQVQMQQLMSDIRDVRNSRKWIIAQLITSLGVLAALTPLFLR